MPAVLTRIDGKQNAESRRKLGITLVSQAVSRRKAKRSKRSGRRIAPDSKVSVFAQVASWRSLFHKGERKSRSSVETDSPLCSKGTTKSTVDENHVAHGLKLRYFEDPSEVEASARFVNDRVTKPSPDSRTMDDAAKNKKHVSISASTASIEPLPWNANHKEEELVPDDIALLHDLVLGPEADDRAPSQPSALENDLNPADYDPLPLGQRVEDIGPDDAEYHARILDHKALDSADKESASAPSVAEPVLLEPGDLEFALGDENTNMDLEMDKIFKQLSLTSKNNPTHYLA